MSPDLGCLTVIDRPKLRSFPFMSIVRLNLKISLGCPPLKFATLKVL